MSKCQNKHIKLSGIGRASQRGTKCDVITGLINMTFHATRFKYTGKALTAYNCTGKVRVRTERSPRQKIQVKAIKLPLMGTVGDCSAGLYE